MIGEVVVEESIPVRQLHVHREIIRHLIHIEILFDDFPLLAVFRAVELIHQRLQILMPPANVCLLRVLTCQTVPKPQTAS